MTCRIWALFLLSASSAQAAQPFIPPYQVSSAAINVPYDVINGTLPYSKQYPQVTWFKEHLEYELKWGILALGEATLGVPQIDDFGGQPAFRIVSTARTTKFGDKFYKVRDLNESWVHVGDFRSLGYSKKLREGDFFRDEWVLYDYSDNTWLSKRVNRDESFHYSTGTIPGAVQDILSAIYMIRPKKLNVGDEIVFDVNTKSTWPLKVKVLRKQTVVVPAGRFKTVVVEPFLREEGLFIQKGKKMQVWLTDDEEHVPVLLKVDIVLGKISAYLTKKGK